MGPSDLVGVAGRVVSPRLAPDHMLGFGIGRNIWYPVLRKINRIRITIWKVCDKRYPAKSYDQISY